MLKVSLAIFFLRVVNKKWQRWVIYASVGIYCTFGTAWLFIALFQCGNPANYLAAQLSAHPSCLDYKTVLGPLNYLHSALVCQIYPDTFKAHANESVERSH